MNRLEYQDSCRDSLTGHVFKTIEFGIVCCCGYAVMSKVCVRCGFIDLDKIDSSRKHSAAQ